MTRIAERAARRSSAGVLDEVRRARAGHRRRARPPHEPDQGRRAGLVGLVATSSARCECLFWAGRGHHAPAAAGSSGSTTCPSGCCRRRSLRRADAVAAEAQRELVRCAAARAHGVATERDLRDYFRLASPRRQRAAIAELVEAGELLPVTVEGWRSPGVSAPRRRACRGASTARALLSPVRPADLGARRAPSGCSASATASRSTSRRRSGCTATTCCRSCSATGWSRGSTSRPTGRPACCASRLRGPKPTRRRMQPASSPIELRSMADWLGLERIVPVQRGDLAAQLGSSLASLA